jgi:hypothetical protein
MNRRVVAALALVALTTGAVPRSADPVPVRSREGVVHGYLILTTTEGDTVAHGDLLQTARGDTVETRLRFRFPDGSVHDERASFTQRDVFRLLGYRLEQRGGAFPTAIDARLDATTGRYTVASRSADGDTASDAGTIDVPDDLYTGVMLVIAKNLAGRPVTVHHVAFTPGPQVIELHVEVAGDEPVLFGSHRRAATHYVIKPDLGFLRGLLASLVGKDPPDNHVWIVREETPGFARFEGPLYLGGPIWRIELASPVFGP